MIGGFPEWTGHLEEPPVVLNGLCGPDRGLHAGLEGSKLRLHWLLQDRFIDVLLLQVYRIHSLH